MTLGVGFLPPCGMVELTSGRTPGFLHTSQYFHSMNESAGGRSLPLLSSHKNDQKLPCEVSQGDKKDIKEHDHQCHDGGLFFIRRNGNSRTPSPPVKKAQTANARSIFKAILGIFQLGNRRQTCKYADFTSGKYFSRQPGNVGETSNVKDWM